MCVGELVLFPCTPSEIIHGQMAMLYFAMVKWPYISRESFPVFKNYFKILFQLVEDKKIRYKSDNL